MIVKNMDNAIKEAFKLNMCVCCLSNILYLFFKKRAYVHLFAYSHAYGARLASSTV